MNPFLSPSVIGYAKSRSICAGETLDFYISSKDSLQYNVKLIRLISPDIGPIGPAFKFTEIENEINGTHIGKYQKILPGSFATIPGPLPLPDDFTISLLVFPTLINQTHQTILELTAENGLKIEVCNSLEAGFATYFSQSDTVLASVVLEVLPSRTWSELNISIKSAEGLITVESNSQSKPSHLAHEPIQGHCTWSASAQNRWSNSKIRLASRSLESDNHDPSSVFNGKLEKIRITDIPSPGASPATIAEWDFSIGMSTDRIVDVGPHHVDGILHNMPSRGIRGSTWNGSSLSSILETDKYAAIHFHDDDIADANWDISHSLDIPKDFETGCYALRLSTVDESTPEFYVPFFVRPLAGLQNSRVAYLIPTTTYSAYANMNLRVTAQFNELAHGRLTVLDSTDLLLLEAPELGKSTYDVHNDGSPVLYSGMNRPVTNFRPNGRMYKFCLDLMIVGWFDAMEIGVDIITDDDLHREGIKSIENYSVLITGSHPEYTTHAQFDAIQSFIDNGGRLMYLGGNGFYTAAEISPLHPDIVEVRRPGQDNLWRVDHTEGTFSTSGLPGGLWRNLGRPENGLVGVGFLTQGFDECTFYSRKPASVSPRVSWIFDGIGVDEKIGDFGVLQGGAAGYEIDRHDFSKGSPEHSVVVASSADHSPVYDLMVSSILDTLPQTGLAEDPIRADMVFFETNNGGAVFSVGSIAWAGSLGHNNYDNNVSKLTLNVLRRFLDKKKFLID